MCRVYRLEMKQEMKIWTKIPHTLTDRTTMNLNLRQEQKMKKFRQITLLSTPKRVGLETRRRKVIACCVGENEVKLNVEQLQVYEEVFRSVNNEGGRICFLAAPRGTLVLGVKELITTVSGN